MITEVEQFALDWMNSVRFDGKYDEAKIMNCLKQKTENGRPLRCIFAHNLDEALRTVFEICVEEFNGNKEKALDYYSRLPLTEAIWAYEKMAFFETCQRYDQATETHEFFNTPTLPAIKAGLGWILHLVDTIIAIPMAKTSWDEQKRLHNETGPAVEWKGQKIYFWHGIDVPEKWIEEKDKITNQDFKEITNEEYRRIFCEIIGWEKLTEILNFRVINKDDFGQLIETRELYENQEPARFCDVRCPSTGRRYVLPTSNEINTCLEGVALSFDMSVEEYLKTVHS